MGVGGGRGRSVVRAMYFQEHTQLIFIKIVRTNIYTHSLFWYIGFDCNKAKTQVLKIIL